jgi:hypothetical protein
MDNGYIIKTNYFYQPWTWIKRVLEFLFGLSVLFWLHLQGLEQETEYSWVKYVLFGLLTVFIFTRPKDELAVDKETFYHIRKSIIPFFTRTAVYKISKIEIIRCAGIFSADTEIFGLLASGVNRNKIEIIFKDNSSISIDLTIHREELNEIVLKINGLIPKQRLR